MAELNQLARPVLRCRTGKEADPTRRQVRNDEGYDGEESIVPGSLSAVPATVPVRLNGASFGASQGERADVPAKRARAEGKQDGARPVQDAVDNVVKRSGAHILTAVG